MKNTKLLLMILAVSGSISGSMATSPIVNPGTQQASTNSSVTLEHFYRSGDVCDEDKAQALAKLVIAKANIKNDTQNPNKVQNTYIQLRDEFRTWLSGGGSLPNDPLFQGMDIVSQLKAIQKTGECADGRMHSGISVDEAGVSVLTGDKTLGFQQNFLKLSPTLQKYIINANLKNINITEASLLQSGNGKILPTQVYSYACYCLQQNISKGTFDANKIADNLIKLPNLSNLTTSDSLFRARVHDVAFYGSDTALTMPQIMDIYQSKVVVDQPTDLQQLQTNLQKLEAASTQSQQDIVEIKQEIASINDYIQWMMSQISGVSNNLSKLISYVQNQK